MLGCVILNLSAYSGSNERGNSLQTDLLGADRYVIHLRGNTKTAFALLELVAHVAAWDGSETGAGAGIAASGHVAGLTNSVHPTASGINCLNSGIDQNDCLAQTPVPLLTKMPR